MVDALNQWPEDIGRSGAGFLVCCLGGAYGLYLPAGGWERAGCWGGSVPANPILIQPTPWGIPAVGGICGRGSGGVG